MTRSLFLLFNHSLTPAQAHDAHSSLGIGKIVDLPKELDTLWRNIPTDLAEITGYLDPIREWLSQEAGHGDYLLIQGDFGACYLMVRFAFENGLIQVYSTTQREASEEHLDGHAVKLIHVFRHNRFRIYGL